MLSASVGVGLPLLQQSYCWGNAPSPPPRSAEEQPSQRFMLQPRVATCTYSGTGRPSVIRCDERGRRQRQRQQQRQTHLERALQRKRERLELCWKLWQWRKVLRLGSKPQPAWTTITQVLHRCMLSCYVLLKKPPESLQTLPVVQSNAAKCCLGPQQLAVRPPSGRSAQGAQAPTE